MTKSSKFGPGFLIKLELLSQPQLLSTVRGAIEPLVEMLGFSEEHCRAIVRAVDEAVSNIIRHSYHGRVDETIEVRVNRLDAETHSGPERGVEILLFDSGPPVDPTKLQARPLDEVRPGGLGLHIIRGSMDTVEYRREGHLNRLRLVKYTRSSKGASESVEEKRL